jgi:hypothetical protein
MKLQYFLLPLAACSALALATEPAVEEYAYGMRLDIDKVVAITEPYELYAPCRVVTAQMTYEDSGGQLHTVEYRRMSSVCSDIEGSL